MNALEQALAGPYGLYVAIAAMALATYTCRAAGYLLMTHIQVTPGMERALQALPGSIVVAIVLPAAIRSGPAAIAGVAAGLGVMMLSRSEIGGLAVGLAVVAALRAAGL